MHKTADDPEPSGAALVSRMCVRDMQKNKYRRASEVQRRRREQDETTGREGGGAAPNPGEGGSLLGRFHSFSQPTLRRTAFSRKKSEKRH
jgi:hypothetical protein